SRGGDDVGGARGWLEVIMAVRVVVVMTWVARGVGGVMVGGDGEVVVGWEAVNSGEKLIVVVIIKNMKI
ncbi:hypothetical protein Tco_1138698, partial [Tanacetum coccineum]